MNILVIDDHALFRQGLRFLLAELDDSVQFLQAETCDEAFSLGAQPDLILLDYRLPGVEGLQALAAVQRHFENVTVVVVSGETGVGVIRGAIEAGAAGYIPKTSSSDMLVAALRFILAGGTYLPPHVLDSDPAETANIDHGLTRRQLEVLLRAIQGKANKVIAKDCCISEGTVKAHLSAAYKVLGVNNRTEAVFAAARLGLTVVGGAEEDVAFA